MKHKLGELLPGEQPWVGKFLNRPLNNYEPFKTKPRKFYEDKFEEIGVKFHVKPFFHQLVCAYLALREKKFMNLVDVGLGKAQPLDAKILTPIGWKLMGELKIGDLIIGGNGKPTKILGIFPQGKKEIFKVIFSDGSHTECCNEHLWLTQTVLDRNNKRRKCFDLGIPKVRSLKEIRESLIYRGMKNHAIPIVPHIKFKSKKIKIDPYIVGALLGDGSIHGSDISITNTEESIISGIKNKLLPNVKSNRKFIPEEYKFNNENIRISLLQGLMDTDGYVSKNGDTIQYTSISIKLIEDVKFIINSLGGTAIIHSKIPTFRYKGKLKQGQKAYTLTIRLPNHISPFLYSKKKDRVKPLTKYFPIRFFTKIELMGYKEAQCLLVEDKSHLYITDDFIVTHNTQITLTVIYGAKKLGLGYKTLVLVPNLINIPSWEDEVETHRPELKFVGLEGNAEERKELLKQDADIFCINYIGLQTLVTKMLPNPRKPGKRCRQIDDEMMADFMKQFDIVIFDEISTVKNTRSTTFKICKNFKSHSKIRLGLTGTPFGRNLSDLWGEYFVIDGGESLGRNQFLFEKVFFDMSLNIWGGMDKSFRKKRMPELKRLMYNCAIRYEQNECFDLPPIIYKPIPLTMPMDMEPYYSKLKEKIREAIMRNNMVMTDIRNLWMQSREVTSNFLQITDENADKVVLDIPSPVKMEALQELCSELPEGHKMVIFHEFIESGNRIEKMILTELKEKCLRVKAGTQDRGDILDSFKNDPACRFLVISSHIGALGLNLQTANYVCFYESPVSPIVRRQAEARVYRTGQKHTTFIYDLFIAGTVEERIRQFLKEGKNLYDELMTNPELAKI